MSFSSNFGVGRASFGIQNLGKLGFNISAGRVQSSSRAVPETITGLLAWFDPDSVYITKDESNKVSAWVSREGNAYTLTQASGPAQMTWSATGILSKPSLTGALSTYMAGAGALAALIDNSAHSVYMVIDPDGFNFGTPFGLGTVANSTNMVRYSLTATNLYLEVNRFQGDGTNTNTTATTAGVGSSPEYVAYTWSGTEVAFRVGGVAVTGGANSKAPVCDLCSIGARKYTGNYDSYFIGKVADIFIYDHVLTAGEITTLEGYITGKYVGI